MMKIATILFLFFLSSLSFAQLDEIDSMILHYESTEHNKEKAELAINISKGLNGVDTEECLKYSNKAVIHARSSGDQLLLAEANNTRAHLATTLGNTSEALQLYFQSLSIYEDLKNYRKIAEVTNNIANTYIGIDDYSKGEKFYQRSYDAAIVAKDSNAIAVPLVGMSILYEKEGKIEQAIASTEEAILLFEGIKRQDAMVVCYANSANYYQQLGDLESAYAWNEKALELNLLLDNKYFYGSIYSSQAEWKFQDGKFSEARTLGEKGLKNFREIGATRDVMTTLQSMSKIYAASGRDDLALASLNQYLVLKDSVDAKNKLETIEEMDAKYKASENEKKIAKLRYTNEIQALENKKNNTILYIAFGGIILMIIIIIVIIAAYQQKKKTTLVLKNKNQIIRHKNKKIVDSIQYAKGIQSAIMPTNEKIKSFLEENFVLFLPKDVVSGDFYWAEEIKDELLIAVADCTGHGVPGAMVSIVCHSALNRSVREFGITEPGKILDKAKELVIETFESDTNFLTDGMDISIARINFETGNIKWAGANNPLYIFRKKEAEIEIIKPNKQPVGKFYFDDLFKTHELKIEKDDLIYLFTDGYMDQFGGPEGKKLKYSKFREILKSVGNRALAEQKEALVKELESWQGDLEQVDDICIIGIKF